MRINIVSAAGNDVMRALMRTISTNIVAVGISKPMGGLALLAMTTAHLALVSPATAQSTASPTIASRDEAGNSSAVVRESSPSADGGSGTDDVKRVDESYQPKGIEMGSFLLLPQLEVSEVFNSNIYATSDNPKNDLITRITPEVRLRSRFPVHALNVLARLDQSVFQKHEDDTHLDGVLLVDGRYDFTKQWEANATAEVNQYYEDRGTPNAAAGKKPTRTRALSTNLQSKARMGSLTLTGDIDLAHRDYADVKTDSGTTINNDDRDMDEAKLTARAGYEFYTGYSLVVEGSQNWRQYDDKFDDNGYQRSSDGQRLRAGIGVDISELLRGDFLVGYQTQDYKDRRLNDPKGYTISTKFNWTPSRLTVVVPSLERSVQETTVQGSSSIVRLGGSLLVRHEVQRNLVLTAVGSISRDNFSTNPRRDWTYDARLRGTWALAPEYYVGGELGYRDRNSSIDSADFHQYVVAVRFGLRV